MKRTFYLLLTGLLMMAVLSGCKNGEGKEHRTNLSEETSASEEQKKEALIASEGMTLETRILAPEGYKRKEEPEESFASFLRGYEMKEDQSPVLLYNGKEKRGQSGHAAVFALPLENEDLQQCADSIMRMYGEYFWHTGQYEKIRFHFVDGFEAVYEKWREGYRIIPEDDGTYWTKSREYDDSYECFVKFMRMVFAYAGTLSMEDETEEITLTDAKAGDVFLKGGSPGHVIMIVDVCENEEGEKAFLLAQGYMPAQEFHVLSNNLHVEDPWYYESEITYPLRTPSYTFDEGSLKRPVYDR